MHISVRPADHADIARLVDLYVEMEAEQTERKPVWALVDGMDEPFSASLAAIIDDPESRLWIGTIDDAVVGFIRFDVVPMLRRASGERLGRITWIYTEPAARGVGVGHAMLEEALATLRTLGVHRFDAPVGPGQRMTKNFFEGHGFAARSIVMYHEDEGVGR